CPHQCAFCNQVLIADRPDQLPSEEDVTAEITRFLTYRQAHHEVPQISFYGGTFLGIGEDNILNFLGIATRFVTQGQAAGIRFSTRPETITPAMLDLIQAFPVKTIELGVQSMDDAVLQISQRGHTALDTRRGVALLKENEYTIGLQMMVGLPGQGASSAMTTAREIAALLPDFVRIYPTVVLKNSHLEAWYQKGTYEPLTLDAAVDQVKGLYGFFREKEIPVIRMGLQASESLDFDGTVIAGPYHPAFGHLVHSEIFFDKAATELATELTPIHKVVFFVHPNSVPKMRGLKNANIKRLKTIFQIDSIELVPEASISNETLRLKVLRN
ncbi:MAG: radical SAM protein, partial [Desulfobacterales bacterium]|nr:radical SAM protein [Desulfobacterales bacterium]MDX2513425.1 radical SAM protein [Desulfobacterales bacterium]